MNQRYNDNIKWPKLKVNQLGILKSTHLCRKILQRVSGSGKSSARFTYLSLRVHPKSYWIFPLKVASTFLNGSRKSTVGI